MDNKKWYELLVKIIRQLKKEDCLVGDSKATVEMGLSNTENTLESIETYDENKDYKKVYLCLYYQVVYDEDEPLKFAFFEGLIDTDNRDLTVMSLDYKEYLSKMNEINPDFEDE